MKQGLRVALAFSAGAVSCAGAYAQELGRVVSSTPVVQQVAIPRQVCITQQVEYFSPKTGAGAAMGAIAGGAAGHALGGDGASQAAVTLLGMMTGAWLGDRIEADPEPHVRDVQQCVTQTAYETRTVAYNVVYEYAGKQFAVQMPQDPGPTVALQISPVGANASVYPPPAPPTPPQTVYVQPPVVVTTQQFYPKYYPRTYYPPARLEFRWGYGGGHRSHRYWRLVDDNYLGRLTTTMLAG